MKPEYAFDSTPAAGTTMPVADGIHWLRMPLPLDLNHINLWLLEDDGGWAIVDTGINTETSKELWRETFTGTMRGLPATHIIATHLHPDHIGCAGWLTRQFDVDLWMTREEYMLARLLVADTGKPAPEEAPSNLGVVGRYILPPEIFPLLKAVRAGVGGEIQLTDAIAALLETQPLMAYAFEGLRYDCGSRHGFIEATIKYAIDHDDIRDDMLEHMAALLKAHGRI